MQARSTWLLPALKSRRLFCSGLRTVAATAEIKKNDDARRKRAADAYRPRHADGRSDAPLLAAGALVARARSRWRAGAGAPARRESHCLSQHRRQGRAAARALRASRRLALFRKERAGRAALPLSRLEIRYRGQLPRSAERAAANALQ